MPTSKPSAPLKVAGREDRRGTQFYPYTIKRPDELRDHDSRENDGMFKTYSQEIVHPHPVTRYQSVSKSQQPLLHCTISEHPQCKPQVAEDEEDKPISSSRLDMIFPKKSFNTHLVTKKDGCSQKESWRVRLYREPSGGGREEDTGDDLEDDLGVDRPYMPGYLAENRQRCLQWLKNIPSDANCR